MHHFTTVFVPKLRTSTMAARKSATTRKTLPFVILMAKKPHMPRVRRVSSWGTTDLIWEQRERRRSSLFHPSLMLIFFHTLEKESMFGVCVRAVAAHFFRWDLCVHTSPMHGARLFGYQDPLSILRFNNLRRSKVKGISYSSRPNLMFSRFCITGVCLCTKESKTRKRGSERRSEREQVLEWLMAGGLNSQPCPFLIKGMNFFFVSPVNNEHPAALKHHPSGGLHRQPNV